MSGDAWRRALLWEVVPEDFTESEALSLIQHEHPAFIGRAARWLEHGWDNRVLDVDGSHIFRFPRSETFPSELELEVLRRLRGRVPVAIPEPKYVGRAPKYMGYRKLEGAHFSEGHYFRREEGDRLRLAQQIAEFLLSVHVTLEKRELEPLGITREDWRPRLDRELSILEAIPFAGLTAFARAAQSDYERFEAAVQDTVVLFDDLHDENMLLDAEGRLCGVIDFGDVSFGDPHWEFRYLSWMSDDLLERSAAAYTALSGTHISLLTVRLLGVVQALCELALSHREPKSLVPVEKTRDRIRRWIERGPALWRVSPVW